MHYCEPLGLESTALVDKLLCDLLKTTEGFQQLKKNNFDLTNKLKSIHESVAPLQSEVSRLMKQNNDLHLSMMKVKEESDQKDHQWRASAKKIEAEKTDLHFLVDKTKDDLRRMEQQNVKLKSRLDTVMSKTYAGKGIPSANSPESNIMGRVQGFEVSKLLPQNGRVEDFRRPDQTWANELRAADERSHRFQEELEQQNRARSLLEDENARLKQQIEVRNQEILRLSSVHDVKVDQLAAKHQQSVIAGQMHQLNERIDYLNSENIRLETELDSAQQSLSKFFSMEKENKHVVESLAQLRNQNQALRQRLAELEKLGNDLQSPNLNQNSELALEVQNLQNKIKTIELESQRLKEEANRAESLRAAYNSDKKAYSDAIERVDQERNRLRDQAKDLEAQLGEVAKELKLTKDQLSMYQVQNQNLRREIETNQQSFSRINKDHLSTTEESYSLRQKISNLESQKNILQSELDSLNFELERANKMRRSAEEQLEEIRRETLKAKSEVDSHSAQKQKFQVLYEGTLKELNNLKDENQHIVKLREKDKQALLEVEDRNRDLNNQLAAALHNVKLVQKEHQSLSDELSAKLEEIRRLSAFKSTIEQELAELRPLKLKYQQLIEENGSLKSQTISKDTLTSKAQKQIENMEQNLTSKEREIKDLHQFIQNLQSDKEFLQEAIEKAELDAHVLNNNAKQAEYINNEANLLRQQINDIREREREYLRQIEGLKSELKKSAEAIKGIQKQLSRALEQKEGAEKDVESLKNRINSMQSDDTTTHHEKLKLEERAFQSELEAEELRRQLGHEQSQKYRIEDNLKHVQNTLEAEKTHNLKLNEQNNQLKSLIANLERIRDDLIKKIQGANQARSLDDNEKSSLIAEIADLKKQLGLKTDDVFHLQDAVKNIDSERDYIQGLLDQKTEEIAVLEHSIANYQKEITQLKDTLNQYQLKDNNFSKRIDERENQLRKLTEKCQYLEAELEEARAGYAQNVRQVQEFQEHIVAITKENQYVNEQLMKMNQEKESIRQSYEDRAKSERMATQMMRSGEREKEDLILTYKKACEENDRLNQSINAITIEQRDTYAKLQACEQELINSQQHISQQEHALFTYQQEINTLERQISHLTYQLEVAEKRCQEVAEAREAMTREVNNARSISLSIESSKEDMQRKLVAVENEKLIAESKLRSIQSELSAIKSQLEFERQKYDDLSQVLAKERDQLFQTQRELDIRGYSGSKSRYEDESIQNQLQATINEKLGLEMEVLKLREDSGKTKHQLYKAENKIKDLEKVTLSKTASGYRYNEDWGES